MQSKSNTGGGQILVGGKVGKDLRKGEKTFGGETIFGGEGGNKIL